MSGWLGVVSRDHVRRGIELGIAQLGHGKHAGLKRMEPGDDLVYYSPRESLGSRVPVRAFTAIGTVADEDVWQADEGQFHPWRRRVAYVAGAREVPLSAVRGELELTGASNWGYQLRRGLLPLSHRDVEVIGAAMRDPG